jgi:uncharacterized protein (TIGR02271 family)
MNTQTVVGVFDTRDAAQAARTQLEAGGIASGDIHLQSYDVDGETHDEGFMSSVSNFFRSMFGDEPDAGTYSEAVRRGSTVVTIDAQSDAEVAQARSALAAAGAVDIQKREEEWRQSGYTAFDASARPLPRADVAAARSKVIPVVQEELAVGKREEDLGAVRVYSRVVERPVTESIELREQHASIERRPVDRPATAADMAAFTDDSIEVREMAERAVVAKTARVVEEVRVGTETTTNRETVTDTVRSTEVQVDRGDAGGADAYRSHYTSNFADQGSYEDFEPAYTYGRGLRSDARYADRDWDSIEADARSDWSTRNPGSSWERFKAAVRHGWETATGQR